MIRNIRELLDISETVYAERTAFQWVDDETEQVRAVTYRQFAHDVRCCAAVLKAQLGTLEDKHIALLAKNSYPYAVYLLAILAIGGVAVPLNCEKDRAEILYELELADVEALVQDGGFFEREGTLDGAFRGAVLPLESSFACAPEMIFPQPDVEKPAMLLFTSGTTGRSKAVMQNQKAIFSAARYHADMIKLLMEKISVSHIPALVVLPFYHVGGTIGIFIHLVLGTTANLCTNLKYIHRDLQKMPSVMTVAVPVIVAMLHKDITQGRRTRLGNLKAIYSVGAMINPQQKKEMMDNGLFVMNSYGMTESFTFGTMSFDQDEQYADSIGHTDTSCRLKISDGELCFKNDGVMMGYYKDEAATREAIDADGWLHTGDLARIDGDGYIWLTGRKKNLIILASGENVSPEELENKLSLCDAITEVLVREWESRICAEVFCKKEDAAAVQRFVDELNETMPMYKRINKVLYRETPFERTATGKIKRGESLS